MAAYLVRVELYGVTDYNALNETMREAGFKTTITDIKGIEYHLPTGEYDLPFGTVPTKRDAMLRVKAAVTRALYREVPTIRALNALPAILITDADDGQLWSGLAPVL